MCAEVKDQLQRRRVTLGPQGVTVRCQCGFIVTYPTDNLGCIECAEPCCPACAFVSEGATYCAACAREIYGLGSRVNLDNGWGLTYFLPQQGGPGGVPVADPRG
jgi:hypothetical protein